MSLFLEDFILFLPFIAVVCLVKKYFYSYTGPPRGNGKMTGKQGEQSRACIHET